MNEKNNEENDNLIYEIGYHLVSSIDESKIIEEVSKLKSLIEENDGVIISEEMPKMTALSYDISKSIDSKKQIFNRAYFGWVKFEADPAKIGNIKNKVESIQNILRFLIVKTVRENTMHTPKIPMFRKEASKEKGEDHAEKPKVSEAELDKSIDELIIS